MWTLRRVPRSKGRKVSKFYDLAEDWELIEASFAMQYGIRLSQEDMDWKEFCNLLAGLGPKTPLGSIVAIRAENDREVLKRFTPDQKRIRDEWRYRHSGVENMTEAEKAASVTSLKAMFAKAFG